MTSLQNIETISGKIIHDITNRVNILTLSGSYVSSNIDDLVFQIDLIRSIYTDSDLSFDYQHTFEKIFKMKGCNVTALCEDLHSIESSALRRLFLICIIFVGEHLIRGGKIVFNSTDGKYSITGQGIEIRKFEHTTEIFQNKKYDELLTSYTIYPSLARLLAQKNKMTLHLSYPSPNEVSIDIAHND